jgi:hypothetical protein
LTGRSEFRTLSPARDGGGRPAVSGDVGWALAAFPTHRRLGRVVSARA